MPDSAARGRRGASQRGYRGSRDMAKAKSGAKRGAKVTDWSYGDARDPDGFTAKDMGEGMIAISQFSEASGRWESIVGPLELLQAALEAFRPRYGTAKNTERLGAAA